ncbi:MAG: hypothetical protein LBT52_07025 [Clostridiales Family XIII bacterium]|jgi:YbbR domain-containing protein|nr:hypothetical protein [Clostridiales Family XIII bacterium]
MSRKKTIDIIIAIIAAIALWSYVTVAIGPTTDKTITAIPVELTNLDTLAADGLAVAAGSYAVDVVVAGPRSDLATLTAGDFTATADMSNYPKGEQNVGVVVKDLDDITIKEIRPNRIQVTVEALVSANKPVKLSYTEKFPDGMEPGFTSAVPGEIEISGTKADVGNVSYVKAEINSLLLNEKEATVTVAAVPVDNVGDVASVFSMSQDSVEITATLCHVKEVPLALSITGRPPGALAVTKQDVPDKVFIRGSKDAIEEIDKVEAASIDISNLRSTSIITPELYLPKGVELAEASKGLAVTIEIGGEEAKSFNVTNDLIEVRGLPEGYSAHIVTDALSVTVFGSHEQLENFSPDDLKLYIDLSTVDLTQNLLKALVSSEDAGAFKRIDISPIAVDVAIITLSGNDSQPENAPAVSPVTGPSIVPAEEKIEKSE